MFWFFLLILCDVGRVESIYRGNIYPVAVKFKAGTGQQEIEDIVKKCGIDTIEPFLFTDTYMLYYSPTKRWPRYLTAVATCLKIQTAVEWYAEQIPKVRVKRPRLSRSQFSNSTKKRLH